MMNTLMTSGMTMTAVQNASTSLTIANASVVMVVPNSYPNWTIMVIAQIVQRMMKMDAWVTLMSQKPRFS